MQCLKTDAFPVVFILSPSREAHGRDAHGELRRREKGSLFLSLRHSFPWSPSPNSLPRPFCDRLQIIRDNWRDESGLKTRTAAAAESTRVLPCVTGGFVGERAGKCLIPFPVVASALIRAFAPQQNRHLGRSNISQALGPVDFLLHYPGPYLRK